MSLMNFKKHDEVMVLSEYNFIRATVVGVGTKNLKLRIPPYSGCIEQTVFVSPDKCATLNEKVCVVHEHWRGRNGRGGHRVERVLYPEARVAAREVARQSYGAGRVSEDSDPSKINQ